MPKKEATAIKTIAVTINKSAVVYMFLTSFSGTAGKSWPLRPLLAILGTAGLELAEQAVCVCEL
jgi:hypothetical protein